MSECVAHTECRLANDLYSQLIPEAYPSSPSLHYTTEMRYINSQMNSTALTKYSMEVLRQIRQNALFNYTIFHLNSTIRSHIIPLGIRKQPLLCKYCRTRAGIQLYHKINTKALRWQNCDKKYYVQQTEKKSGSISTNLIIINSTSIQFKPVHLTTINTRSICNKINQFQHYLLENRIDVCAVTETWLKEDDEYGLHELPPPGFKINSKPRCDGRQGGGICTDLQKKTTPLMITR